MYISIFSDLALVNILTNTVILLSALKLYSLGCTFFYYQLFLFSILFYGDRQLTNPCPAHRYIKYISKRVYISQHHLVPAVGQPGGTIETVEAGSSYAKQPFGIYSAIQTTLGR